MKQLIIIHKSFDNLNNKINSSKINNIWQKIKSWLSIKKITQSTFLFNLVSVSGASIISKLIDLTVLGYTARTLGPEKYGLIAFGSSMAAYAGVVIAPGLLTWGTRAVSRDHSKAGIYLTTLNLTQIFLAIIGYGGLFIYSSIGLSGNERIIVLLSGLRLFASALSVDFIFNGFELMRIPAVLGILSETLNVISLVTLIKSPDDVFRGPLLSLAISLFIIFLEYIWIFYKLKIKLHLADWPEFRSAIIAAIPLSITSLLIVVLHYANNLIVKGYLGVEALGIFYSAYHLVELTFMIPSILTGVFLPRLSRLVVSKPDDALKEASIFAKVHMLFGFLIATIFFSEASGIIHFIYGNQYDTAGNLLMIMSISVIFNYAINGYTNCLISFGKDKVMILVVIASTVVAIGGGVVLVPLLGITGAAIATSLIDLAGWLVSLPYYKKAVGSFQVRVWIRPILASIIMVLVGFLLKQFLPIFLLRVFILIIVFFIITSKDVKEIIHSLS